MHVLAVLMVGLSISIAAFVLDDTDNPNGENFPLLESLLPDSSSLESETTGNEPSIFKANLDTTVFQIPDKAETLTFNPNTAQGPSANAGGVDIIPFEYQAVTESSTYKPNIAQGPIANGAGESSINNPLTIDTEAQIDTDETCHSHSITGQKIKKKDETKGRCINPDSLMHGSNVPHAGQRTPREQRNDKLQQQDKDWERRVAGMSNQDARDVFNSFDEGEEACKKQGAPGGQEPIPLCCLGPEENIGAPTFEPRLVRREVQLMDVYNCAVFLVGRPFCARPERVYCCKYADPNFTTDWGFKGLNCARMEYDLSVPLILFNTRGFQ